MKQIKLLTLLCLLLVGCSDAPPPTTVICAFNKDSERLGCYRLLGHIQKKLSKHELKKYADICETGGSPK